MKRIYQHILIFLFTLFNSSKKRKNHTPDFFIVSSGRSGTTLLRKLLINSKQVHIPPESNDWIPSIAIIFTKHFYKSWEKKIQLCLNILKKDPDFKFWNIDLDEFHAELIKMDSEKRNFYGFIDKLYTFNLQDKSLLIGDKTPYLVLELRWLKTLYPNAGYIHLVRDSREVIGSRMKNFDETLEQATNRWIWAMKETKDNFKSTDKNFIEVRYEDLVSNPENTLKNISSFLKIEYSAQMLNNQKEDLGDTHLDHHKNTSKPINSKSVQKWIEKFSESEIEYINKKTKSWLIEKGYD